MEIAKNLMIILLTGILTENFVLSKFLGICPFLGVSKKLDSSIGMGAAVTFVMVCASLVTYPIYYGILVPLGIEYMNTIAFILVIAVFVQLVEMVLKKYMPPLYKSLGVYLPLITTNCAVLGVTLLNLTKDYDLLESVVNSFGAGLGFMIAMILSDLCSGIFLWNIAGLGKFFRPYWADRDTMRMMVRFSLPLIPTAIMWIITGFSDRLLIKYIDGPDGKTGDTAVGLYTAASKVPNLISMVSTVFFQAWNMSAITEHGNKGEGRFFGTVFSAYQSIMYIASAFLITLVQPVSKLLLNYNNHPEYAKAYLYTPVLILAVLMMCFNLFFSSIYTASQHTKNSFWTSMVSMVLNVVLNIILIKKFGVHGAVAASFISYVACYIIRVIDARRYIYFKAVSYTHLTLPTT